MSCDCEDMGRVALGCTRHETEPDEVDIKPICVGCHKEPHEIGEYYEAFVDDPEYFESPADVVKQDEGTYNRRNGHFLCTDCYIKAGQPSSPNGWVAP